MIGLAALIATCAPLVHPTTMRALVHHESQANALAIGVNRGSPLPRQPNTKDEAVAAAKRLIASGASADFGIAQINSANLSWLGLDAESAFDSCASLTAGQTVLLKGYKSAVAKYGPGQQALDAALSTYNTGSPTRGIENGYVAKVRSRVVVPALDPGAIITPVVTVDGKKVDSAKKGTDTFGENDQGAFTKESSDEDQ